MSGLPTDTERERAEATDVLSRLAELETEARKLEPGAEERAELQAAVLAYGERFLDDLPTAQAYVVTEDKGVGLGDLPVLETGRPIEELLRAVEHDVDRPGLNPASAGHMGYIPGGGIYPSSLGDYLAAVTNRYAGVFFASPGAVRMQNMMVRWMADLIGYPDTAGGDLTSGGSIANLIAVVAAREAQQVGAADVPRSVIYTTSQVHHCVGKALVIAGLREAVVRTIRVDEHFRMDPADLDRQIEEDGAAGLQPFLVVASAGTTDTGAVDPIGDIADVADKHELWFHVDGAYGGFFALCPEAPPALAQLHRADSVVLDPHKGLFLPYGSGALVVKDRDTLYRAHRYEANYMQDTLSSMDEPSPADHSPELTRHSRGPRMWLPLQLFGVGPFRASLSEKIWLTRWFYDEVQSLPHVEVGPYPDLSVMMFRFTPPGRDANEFNRALIQRIHEDGRVFLSSTHIDGVDWLRLAVLVFRTHKEHIDLTLQMLRELVPQV